MTSMKSPRPRCAPLALVLACAACTDGKGAWRDFYGIQYRADGAHAHETDGVLPGPEGLGGIPSGVRPSVVLTRPDGYHVEIAKPAQRLSLEAEKASLEQSRAGSNFREVVTSDGWELTYDRPTLPGAEPGRSGGEAHVIYREIAAGNYQCSWADVSGRDPRAAEAVCRSIRPRR
ncbi:hypothetical protein [Sorangium sp. So ce131]|uniref:hypothetical protein n=1 Tax=Sorangium sp. So ce131 TaxID=3133282 RepID=UPI003F62AC8F